MGPRDDETGNKFDASDEVVEDTQPDALAVRRRHLAAGASAASDALLDVVLNTQKEMGTRLAALEGRLTTMVGRVIDLMVSDQDDHEVLQAVLQELAETKSTLKKLVAWIEENTGP